MPILNFPNNPSVGDTYTGDNGISYIWDGNKWGGHTAAIDTINTNSSYLINNGNVIQVDGSGNLVIPVGATILDADGNQVVTGGGGTANGWQLTSGTAVVSLTDTGKLTLPFGSEISETLATSGVITGLIVGSNNGFDQGIRFLGTPNPALDVPFDDGYTVDITWTNAGGTLWMPTVTVVVSGNSLRRVGDIVGLGYIDTVTTNAGNTLAPGYEYYYQGGISVVVTSIDALLDTTNIKTSGKFAITAVDATWTFDGGEGSPFILPESTTLDSYVDPAYPFNWSISPTNASTQTYTIVGATDNNHGYSWPGTGFFEITLDGVEGGVPNIQDNMRMWAQGFPYVVNVTRSLANPDNTSTWLVQTANFGAVDFWNNVFHTTPTPLIVQTTNPELYVGPIRLSTTNDGNLIFAVSGEGGWDFKFRAGVLTIPTGGDVVRDGVSAFAVSTASGGLSISVSDSAPALSTTTLWFNSLEGRTYITYDGNWVDASPLEVPDPTTYLDGLTINGTTISALDTSATISIQSGNALWQLGTDGVLTIPTTGDIKRNGVSVLGGGATGATGHVGATGIQGSTGHVGATGEKGATGSTGPVGATGFDGATGHVGATGEKGATGSTGPVGATGFDGATGEMGATGQQGDTGSTGYKGTTGATGPQGISVTLQGTKATIGDLPLTGSAGHGWIVTTGDGNTHLNGSLWFWNVSEGAWNDIGPIVGPEGGPGPDGATGMKGATGATGPHGEVGATGFDGATGFTGDDGATGATGPAGDVGATGFDGATGFTGNDGSTGATGPAGDVGATGSKGDPGVGLSISDFGEGFSLDNSDKIVTNKLYSTNLTQPTQHYRLEVDTNGVVILPDQSIINGSYMRAIHGSYAGLAAGPDLAHNEESWMWVDADGAWIATKYSSSAYTWKFDNNGKLTLPGGQLIGGSDSTQGITMTTDRGTVLFGNSPECVPTLLTHFHIMKDDPANVDLFLGDDNNYVKLPGSGETAYGVEIGTNVGSAYTWRFGTDGNLTIPGGITKDGETLTLTVGGGSFTSATLGVLNPTTDFIIGSENQGLGIQQDGTTVLQSKFDSGAPLVLIGGNGASAGQDGGGVGIYGGGTLDSNLGGVDIQGQYLDILTNDGTHIGAPQNNGWTFDNTDFGLVFPDETTQYTAYQGSVLVSDTAPSDDLGRIWFNSVDGRAYIKYNDLWTDLSPIVVPDPTTYLDGLTINGTTISPVDSTGTVSIQTGLDTKWTFGTDGSLTLPAAQYDYSQIHTTGGLQLDGWHFGSDNTLTLPVAGGTHAEIHVAAGEQQGAWRLDAYGTLTLPTNGDIQFTNGKISTIDGGLTARAYNGAFTITVDEYQPITVPTISWTFDVGGVLTLPGDATIYNEKSTVPIGVRYNGFHTLDDNDLQYFGTDTITVVFPDPTIAVDLQSYIDNVGVRIRSDQGGLGISVTSIVCVDTVPDVNSSWIVTAPGANFSSDPSSWVGLGGHAIFSNNIAPGGVPSPGATITAPNYRQWADDYYTKFGPDHEWTFGTDGVLTIPATGDILRNDISVFRTRWDATPTVPGNNCPIFAELTPDHFYAYTQRSHIELDNDGHWYIGSNANATGLYGLDHDTTLYSNFGNVVIRTGENDLKYFTFDSNGSLTFPDDTTQTTAWQGSVLISDTAPDNDLGRIWFNSVDGRAYVKYNDLWADLSPIIVPNPEVYLEGLTIEGTTIGVLDTTATQVVNFDAELAVKGNIEPTDNLVYNLGSPTRQWNALYVSSSTIYMSGRALSLTNEGLQIDGGTPVSVIDGGDASTWLTAI